MLNFYKTIDNRVRPISVVEDGCWVCAICPTEQEVRYLVDILGLEQDFVRAALDEEASSRVESEEDQPLVIVDVRPMPAANSSVLSSAARGPAP